MALLDSPNFTADYTSLAAVNASNVTTLPVNTKTGIIIPIITFALGVLSNGLAIVILLNYKFNGSTHTITESHAAMSRDQGMVTHDTTYTDGRQCSSSRKPGIKFGAFHTLVLTLAVLDLMGILCTSPVTFLLYVNNVRIKSFGGMSLCFYSAFAMLFFGFSSMAMVMAMSVERLLSIRHPYYYHRRATANKALILAFIVLLASAILAALPVTGFGAIRPMYPYSWCFADWTATSIEDKIFNFLYVALGITMLLVTIICNVSVIVGLVQMRRSLHGKRCKQQGKLSCETQMIIQLLAITIIFITCWLPLMFRILLNQLGYPKSGESDRIAIWLVACNPILDPWVYILFRKKVAKQIIRLIKKFTCFYPNNEAIILQQSGKKFPNNRDQHTIFLTGSLRKASIFKT